MKITVNGETKTIDPDTTIAALLKELGIPLAGTAVAVGEEIVPRGEHGQRTILEGERVEILRAIGGG